MAKAKPAPVLLPNIHPVDELYALREEIKQLEKQADKLREPLLKDGADLKGDLCTGKITSATRETLDRKALTEAYGEEAIAPYLRTTSYKVLKIEENDQ